MTVILRVLSRLEVLRDALIEVKVERSEGRLSPLLLTIILSMFNLRRVSIRGVLGNEVAEVFDSSSFFTSNWLTQRLTEMLVMGTESKWAPWFATSILSGATPGNQGAVFSSLAS